MIGKPISAYGILFIFLSNQRIPKNYLNMRNQNESIYHMICSMYIPVELLCSSFFRGELIFGDGFTGEPTFWYV